MLGEVVPTTVKGLFKYFDKETVDSLIKILFNDQLYDDYAFVSAVFVPPNQLFCHLKVDDYPVILFETPQREHDVSRD